MRKGGGRREWQGTISASPGMRPGRQGRTLSGPNSQIFTNTLQLQSKVGGAEQYIVGKWLQCSAVQCSAIKCISLQGKVVAQICGRGAKGPLEISQDRAERSNVLEIHKHSERHKAGEGK